MRSLLVFLSLVLSLPAQREPESCEVLGYGDFPLPAVIDLPAEGEEVSRVMVLVHGSGSQGMDGDLTAVTKNGEKNLFFVELGQSLSQAGFAVLRYDKRTHVYSKRMREEPSSLNGDESLQAFTKDPLLYLVEDCKAAVDFAVERFPDAAVYILGHSQGTYLAVQVAHQHEAVKGIALIGFASTPMSFLHFEQTVYRPLRRFRALDLNDDEVVDEAELEAEPASFLKPQLGNLDRNGDGQISRLEYQAASMAALVLQDPLAGAYLRREATYPRIPDVLRNMQVPVVFLQGMLANQTLSYQAMAVQLVNERLWKNEHLHFRFFDGLGHALDPRDSYDDLQYRRVAPEAKAELVDLLTQRFK